MPAYQIFTDSCSDLTPGQCRQLDVICAPLSVIYKGITYRDFSDPGLLNIKPRCAGAGLPGRQAVSNM